MLVSGAGIGTGILTIPYAVSKIGLFGTVVALIAAYIASGLFYFIIADLTRNSDNPFDLLAILDQHLFGAGRKKVLNVLFFVLLVLLLLENLIVYILCAGNVMSELLGIDGIWTKIIFYVLASIIPFFGIKGMGVGEKISMILVGTAVVVLTVLSFLNVKNPISFSFGPFGTVFAVYGLFMFAFSAIFSVIQVCNHIEKREYTAHAIIGGLTLNALITAVFTLSVILGSDHVTEIATIGLANGIGIPAVRIVCSVLVLLAMFTSFWSSGFAFADTVSGKLRLPSKAAWFLSTLPALLFAIFIPLGILDYVQIGAGALSVILILVVLPAYWHAVREPVNPPLLGKLSGNRVLIVFLAAAILLMAASSFVPIN